MEDEQIVYIGMSADHCPMEDIMTMATDLCELVDGLEALSKTDHRHPYFYHALKDLQSAQNWINRWLGENILDDNDLEESEA